MTKEQKRREMFPAFQQALEDAWRGRPAETFPDDFINGLVSKYGNGEISERQAIICFNKWMHGFNLENVTLDLSYMVGEVSEVFEALSRDAKQEMAYELADVAIYCYGIANMIGFDLDAAIEHKMKEFFGRNYQQEDSSEEKAL